jgi:hypothetical protein
MQTMGEFASLTERLALMADPALQQFAQMHKDDPFTLSLAVSESNRRRKMRTAQQGVAGMQPQPPVADQEIAQMAEPAMPENVGIGALPAPSMAGMPAGGIAGEEEMEPQTMAGGGMVAFRDGGDVERYQVGGNVAGVPSWMQWMYSGETPTERARRERLEADAKAAAQERAAARGETLEQERARNMAAAATAGSPPGPRNSPAMVFPPAAEQLRLAAAGEEIPVSGIPPAASSVAPAQQSSSPPPASAAGAAAAGAASTTQRGGLGDLASLFNTTLAAQNYTDPAAAQLKALETKELAAAQAEKTALERDQARFADAFKGREARLGERAAEIGKQKDTNTGLAFLNAGLAIMSTPGGLATAIGKGARVGTEQFASGLDKIRSAQEKLDEARDRMEELKLNRAEMSAKEVRTAESKIRQVGIDAEKRGIDGLRQAAGVNRETAKTIFDKTVQVGATREEIASRERVAAMQERGATARANALPGEIRAAMLLGTGETDTDKLRTGLPALMDLKDRLTDAKIAELYGKHVADAKKDMSTPLSPEDFAKAIKAATGAYRPKVADVENARPR